jgi:glycogen synthase
MNGTIPAGAPLPQEPLRVLMTADTVGGVWTYAMELIAALQPEVEVILATMGAPLNASQWREVERLGIEVHESIFKLEWMDQPWKDVAEAGEWLLALERQIRPDLIHLNNFAHGALPWETPVLMTAHSCVYSWWTALHGTPPQEGWRTYHRIVREGLRAADVIVAPSRALMREIQRHYGPLKRSQVIYNGRSRWHFTERAKEPFVFCAGRLWDQAKNVQALARAAKGIPWPVYVAGETAAPGGSPQHYSNVRMLGPLAGPGVSYWMSRASIYALPAKYEPFGLSVLEAALSGCALVLGDIPSLREIWGEAAVYVTPDDSVALQETLRELTVADTQRRRLARAARERAHAYSSSALGFHYLGLYQQAVRERVEI